MHFRLSQVSAFLLGLLSAIPINSTSAVTTVDVVTTVTATVTLGYIETVTVTAHGQKHSRGHPIYFVRDSGQGGNGNSESGSGIQTNQMDLLSGIPTLLLIVVGIVQLWPSSSNVCQSHIREFLNWLKANIESDFSVTVFSCHGTCHTSTFDFSTKMLKRRIGVNIGSSQIAHCSGDGHISVEELTKIIQSKNNGSVLMELARLARYPNMKNLSMAIRILEFSSAFSNQVIFLQWLNLAVVYIFNWILRDRLPDLLYQIFLFISNTVCIVLRVAPAEYSPHKPTGLRHDMAELAMYHVISEHVPWVRYGIYYMLMNLSGRQVTIDSSINDSGSADDDQNRLDWIISSWYFENQGSPEIKHPLFIERILATRITSDPCSAARVLYSIALHSLRINLICSHIGYPPPNVLLGSFRKVKTNTSRTQFVFKHQNLNAIFEDLYRYRQTNGSNKMPIITRKSRLYRVYTKLVNMLKSQMGSAIFEQYSVQALVNLTICKFPSSFVDALINPSGSNVNWDELKTAMLEVEMDLVRRLVWEHYKTCKSLIVFLRTYITTKVHWGALMWLLLNLHDFWNQSNWPSVPSGNPPHIALRELTNHLIKIIYSPYMFRQRDVDDIGDSGKEFGIIPDFGEGNTSNVSDNDLESDFETFSEEIEAVGLELNINQAEYRDTVPAWCLCTDHCRGICTLIIENCGMRISNKYFFRAPYTFSKYKDFVGSSVLDNTCALVCLVDQKMLLELASFGTYFKRYKHKSVGGQPMFKLSLVGTNEALSKIVHIASPVIHYGGRRDKRIDERLYILSRLLYEDANQVVAIFNNHIYCIGLEREGSRLRWMNAKEKSRVDYWVGYYEVAMINKAVPLSLDEVSYGYSGVESSSKSLKLAKDYQYPKIRNFAEEELLEDCVDLETIYV
ncbi:hypothetical protein FB645_002120 [Coemansia sp. IMI 203386]|nr:hypothetical protein FB645_002120 [Coemansia sp. IMI 203386]